MRGTPFTARVDGGELGGWVDGHGAPLLLLHGGPGLSYEYLDEVAADIGEGYEIAAFQQRGIAPSMLDGPWDIATHLADACVEDDTAQVRDTVAALFARGVPAVHRSDRTAAFLACLARVDTATQATPDDVRRIYGKGLE